MPIYLLEVKYEGVMHAFKAKSFDEAKERVHMEYRHKMNSLEDYVLSEFRRGNFTRSWDWVQKLDGGYWEEF